MADLVRLLAIQVLEAEPATEPARLWRWIGWLANEPSYKPEAKRKLADLLRKNCARRAALQEHVLLTPCVESTWIAAWRLADTDPDLHPTGQDLARMLKTLRTRTGGDPIDPDTWRDLLRLGRSENGLPDVVHRAALEAASDDPGLLSVLERMSDISEAERKIEQRRREAQSEAERQRKFQTLMFGELNTPPACN